MIACDECGSPVLPSSDGRGEFVCVSCSLVSAEMPIDSAPILGPDGRHDGHGPALSVQNGITMTTTPAFTSRDSSGRPLTPAAAAKFQYLANVDSRVVSKRDRSSKRLHQAVSDLALRLQVDPATEQRALRVATKAVEAKALKGWEFSLVAGGALYFALVERDGYAVLPRIAGAVRATHPGEREKNLRRALKEMERVMGGRLPRASAYDVARAVAAGLGLPASVIGMIRHTTVSGSESPLIDAGAIVYSTAKALGISVSQKEVAEAVGATDVSLRKRLADAKLQVLLM